MEWGKSGDLYWLGHDLMWTLDVMLRGADKPEILHGIRQSIHHARELALTVCAQRLEKLHDAVNSAPESLTTSHRDEFGIELRRITDQFGAIAEAAQPGFRASPEGIIARKLPAPASASFSEANSSSR